MSLCFCEELKPGNKSLPITQITLLSVVQYLPIALPKHAPFLPIRFLPHSPLRYFLFGQQVIHLSPIRFPLAKMIFSPFYFISAIIVSSPIQLLSIDDHTLLRSFLIQLTICLFCNLSEKMSTYVASPIVLSLVQ